MHLLAARPGVVDDGAAAVDLGQTPGDIVILTAADTEISALAAARARIAAADPAAPSVRVASLLRLGHNYSVDLYAETVAAHARLVVGRLLGGRGYWPYGVERLTALCRRRGIPLAWLPGDDQPDAELADLSTLPAGAAHRLWQYCVHGGPDNAENFLRYAATLTGRPGEWREPAPLPRAGLYWPGCAVRRLEDLPWWPDRSRRPVAALLFYRALVQAAETAPVDSLVQALDRAGLNALPVWAASLKDPVAVATAATLLRRGGARIALNATAFSLGTATGTDAAAAPPPFDAVDGPVLQLVFAGGDEAVWRDGTAGLSARDIAMHVALPEMDGRILSRAVSFKGHIRRDPLVQADISGYRPVADRCEFTARLAAAWVRLRRTPAARRRVALLLANYPNRDARLGNGVGLDTPASACVILAALRRAGYDAGLPFADGGALIRHLAAGPTNAAADGRDIRETLPLADYQAFFAALPAAVREAVTARWGGPEGDPFFLPGRNAFALPLFRRGNVVIGLQPARGYNIDPVASYHCPDLPPPHGYLAFYAWLRGPFDAHALVHLGKHGNLEWLPGKAVALSGDCFPEVALGPLPHLYPFIVNDPGEGTQAKRRAQAVIVDHLTPPLTRAESYGPLRELEQLVDEYFEAAGVDPRRTRLLKQDILDLARRTGLDRDCGMEAGADDETALARLDGYLCELKEMQIRDGLHVFGESPEGGLRDGLLLALLRIPRGTGEGGDASLIRALAADLALDAAFDPLNCDMAAPWQGARPAILAGGSAPWRTCGDTVERLEQLALSLVADPDAPPPGPRSRPVLAALRTDLAPRVARCGGREISGLLAGLDGRFLPPGPSGAPTRGRPDVLPTGRNFYSLDTRTVPTPAAWRLGWESAGLLMERHAQDHGAWPRRLVLTAWGTANMRTGGDDIAQALALMGVRPVWDGASRRVTGFEVLPLTLLDRPRVDVTLRISGFFRDAFPGLIDLVDSAARAVAALDEPEESNPLAAAVRAEQAELAASGMEPALAKRRAGARVFGAKPGAYGAGLQALIDEKGWETGADLANAYIAWGGYAYGAGQAGASAHGAFRRRLAATEAVLHNQDNREHDLLDSDDYYQFEGGLAVAVRTLSGRDPAVYHNDHSRPEFPKIRTLREETARVVRARVVNPRWIRGVMRHGYKGAFEMAATVDYLFAFAATAGCVADHHFEAVCDAYLRDDAVRGFLARENPAALRDIAARLQEAIDRDLWKSRRNDTHHFLRGLQEAAGSGPPGGG